MKARMSAVWAAPLVAVLLSSSPSRATDETVVVDGLTFDSWTHYFESDYFKDNGKRCGTPDAVEPMSYGEEFRGTGADCSCSSTTIDPQWNDSAILQINVVVHIIRNTSGTGEMSDELVQSQIDVLNEDFRAVAGGPGEEGYDTRIQFVLASFDPDGNPTTGITRSTNNTWFSDGGGYYNTLAWDPDRYLNIYTNNPGSGILGYVPFLPACTPGSIGALSDRVVCLYSAFGRPALGGPPYNLGRTVTHEVGHYLGLFHTFQSGCGTASCYTTGDRICDTEPEANPRFGCQPSAMSCGTLDPVRNYMDYSNDSCMDNYTFEQANRLYCTLVNWRDQLGNGIVATQEAPTVAMNLLNQNRPNPFNPTTEISYELSAMSRVELQILDVSGRVVRNLHKAVENAGRHAVTWDGTNDEGVELSSGVYFYRLKSDGGTQTRRMILMK